MISKKNKALVAGVLAAATTATAVVPALGSAAWTNSKATEGGANESYAAMFESLYDDVITNGVENGYLSKTNNGGDSFGIPYHSVETLCVEAPDYGHETTSEAMSYIVWIASMHDVLAEKGIISGSSDLKKAWTTLEAMIPGWSKAHNRDDIDYSSIWKLSKLEADSAEEGDTPDAYPVKQVGGKASNPYFDVFKSAYGSDNGYYLMNWLADVDDWYGFGGGTPGAGTGDFVFINTFQRGEQESCFETVPQPCLEELKYGNTDKQGDNGNGIKAIFNGKDQVPSQYAFTNAPDAEDRAIQAIYFANRYGVNTGDLSALAGKMGDQCRNDMFDKYYKAISKNTKITDTSVGAGTGSNSSQHFLMAWYTSWGGALTASYGDYQWAWQIGCSHSHQFYQNPLAAYGLIYDSKINAGMKAKGATEDYKESLKRQIEMYLWLQSVDGPFAGGCTNSWRGRYETYPDGHATFYDMAYVAHPVYADPGSNHWIGNQVWSTQRLAELYYDVMINGDKTGGMKFGGLSLEDALDALLSRWIEWFEKNTKFDYVAEDGTEMSYAIPSNLDWGKSDTDYTCTPDTWTGKYDPNGNQSLTCTITGYGQGDIGCVSSLCNTLIYYAAAKGVAASEADPATAKDDSIAAQGLRLANKLLSKQWNGGRDDIGLAYEDHNGSLKRIFEQEVYIPDYYKGEMPDGSKLEPGATFSSIRKSYESDPMYQECKKVYEATGGTDDYTFKLHRFWHMGDALMSYGGMALLYPDVKPLDPEDDSQTTTGSGDILWGDTNEDGEVNLADAVLIMQNLANPTKYKITDQGKLNGDVDSNGDGLTGNDAFKIQQFVLGLITTLDPNAK